MVSKHLILLKNLFRQPGTENSLYVLISELISSER